MATSTVIQGSGQRAQHRRTAGKCLGCAEKLGIGLERIVLVIKRLLFWLSHGSNSPVAQKDCFLSTPITDLFQLFSAELPLVPTLRKPKYFS